MTIAVRKYLKDPSLILEYRELFVMRFSRARAKSFGSLGFTRSPSSPSVSISGILETLVATIGKPKLIASNKTKECPS